MTLKVITVVKGDLAGLMRTEKSIRGQSKTVSWTLVTPNDQSSTYEYARVLSSTGNVGEIILDTHHGIYAAMNQAIASSSSEDWLWFLNAGDEFADVNSYKLVNERTDNSTNEWMYGGHYLGSHQGNILGEIKAPTEFKIDNQLFAKKYVSHQSTIFRAKFLKELGGFDLNLKIAADWDLMVRASKLDAGLTIGRSISVFYLGGLSTRSRQIGNFELLKLRKKYLGRHFFFANYAFFLYRCIRNFFVVILENTLPSVANFIRKLRFNFR